MVPPDGGSRILFFSGGTALAPVAAELSRHTRNAVHVITTFDSGGSSAELRRAFDMPAVGDIRARIMALADRYLEGNPEIVELLGYRLPKDAGPEALHRELASLASGAHPLVAAIPEPMNEVVTQHLSAFRSLMPVDMDLAGASIGNLILTSGYLSLDRQLEPVVRVFSGMVQARGVVMPVADSCAHLCVRLENGEVIVGQHRFTGKTATAITSPILDMWLSASLDDPSPVSVPIQPRLAHVIRTADLICYPVGSFFSSVMANLLPLGVSCAVREAACPKVFIPNLGTDPELFGLTVHNVSGKIDDARFAKMSKRYEQEQRENAKKIKALRLELKKDESKRMDIDDFLETVRRYTDAATITRRMVAELIDHIEVYHAEKQDGVTNQRVVIYYNCIGAFDVPDRRKIPEADIIMEKRKGVALSYAPERLAV